MCRILAPVMLYNCQSRCEVRAQIIELDRETAKRKIDAVWWSGLGISKRKRRRQRDHAWKWHKRFQEYRDVDTFASVAIRSDTGDIEGAMIYTFEGSSVLTGDRMMSIDFLATAPRNRKHITGGRLVGVGTSLVAYAVRECVDSGLGGRTVIESLNDPETMEFYENLGFRKNGLAEDDIIGYELATWEAQRLLERQKHGYRRFDP